MGIHTCTLATDACLRKLYELGASLTTPDIHGCTPAHTAGPGRLRALSESGAAATFCAVGCCIASGNHAIWSHISLGANQLLPETPAHHAARRCYSEPEKVMPRLRELHEALASLLEPQIANLRALEQASQYAPTLADELSAHKSLSWTSPRPLSTRCASTRQRASGRWFHRLYVVIALAHATMMASIPWDPDDLTWDYNKEKFEEQGAKCRSAYKFLSQIGGAKAFEAELRRNVHLLDLRVTDQSSLACLLADADLLELETKQAWLVHKLAAKADAADGEVSVIVRRDNLLDGACEQLGVQEATGRVVAQAQSFGALRGRERNRRWASARVAHRRLLRDPDPQRGLFVSTDGPTLRPNPLAARTAPTTSRTLRCSAASRAWRCTTASCSTSRWRSRASRQSSATPSPSTTSAGPTPRCMSVGKLQVSPPTSRPRPGVHHRRRRGDRVRGREQGAAARST